MAVPKRKVSKARRDRRRTAKERLEVPGMVECPKCGNLVLSHHVCKNCGTYDGKVCGHCGYYNGKEVIKVEDEKQK